MKMRSTKFSNGVKKACATLLGLSFVFGMFSMSALISSADTETEEKVSAIKITSVANNMYLTQKVYLEPDTDYVFTYLYSKVPASTAVAIKGAEGHKEENFEKQITIHECEEYYRVSLAFKTTNKDDTTVTVGTGENEGKIVAYVGIRNYTNNTEVLNSYLADFKLYKASDENAENIFTATDFSSIGATSNNNIWTAFPHTWWANDNYSQVKEGVSKDTFKNTNRVHKNTEVRNKKDASCNTAGYTGDTWCTDCNTMIESGSEIPATNAHVDADGKWESDDTQHYHTCSCGTKFDVADHTGGTATCSEKAVCSVCGVEYGAVDGSKHVNTEVRDAVAATEESEGYSGDTWCLDCKQKIKEGTTVDKLDHTHDMAKTEAKAATCEEDGNIEYYTCSKCGKKYNDAAGTRELTEAEIIVKATGHSYGTDWKSDADNHWHECTCGDRTEIAPHTFGEWTITKEATEIEKGSKEKTCTVCGYKVTEVIPVVENDTDTHNPDKESDSP